MSTNLASLVYKTATPYGRPLDAIPRQKFAYRLSAVFSGEAGYTQGSDTFWLLADSVELPSHSYTTTTLNQYNRKRVVQTRVDYDPISISIVDTVDNSFLSMMIAYSNYYYGGNLFTKSPDQYALDTTVDNDFNFGYSPVSHTGKYFFDQIIIHREAKGEDQKVILINPIIAAVRHDTLSYNAGADATRWQIQLVYEGIQYEGFGSTVNVTNRNQGGSFFDPGATVQTPTPATAVDGGLGPIVRDRNGNPVTDSQGNPVRSGSF